MIIPDTDIQYAPSLEALARVFDFGEYVDLFLILNSRGGSEFHNFLNAQWAVEDTYRYYKSQVDTFEDPPPKNHTRLALIAALFKDCNHGGGSCSDQESITRAIVSVHDASALAQKPLSSNDLKIVTSAISSTLVSLSVDDARHHITPTNIMECALRDAELSLVFRIFTPEGKAQYEGLLFELNRVADLSGKPYVTMDSMRAATKDFMMKSQFLTPLGQMIKDKHLQKCLDFLDTSFSKEGNHVSKS